MDNWTLNRCLLFCPFLVLLGPKETRVQAGADLHKRLVQNRRNGNELKGNIR